MVQVIAQRPAIFAVILIVHGDERRHCLALIATPTHKHCIFRAMAHDAGAPLQPMKIYFQGNRSCQRKQAAPAFVGIPKNENCIFGANPTQKTKCFFETLAKQAFQKKLGVCDVD